MWVKISSILLVTLPTLALVYIFFFGEIMGLTWDDIQNAYNSTIGQIPIKQPKKPMLAVLYWTGIFVEITIVIHGIILIVKCKKRQNEENKIREENKNDMRRESQIEKMFEMFTERLRFFKENEKDNEKDSDPSIPIEAVSYV